MNYVLFIICDDGRPTPEQLAVLQREIPGWVQEMQDRGVQLLGRELDLPQTAATVRVRDGETLVTDGPFAETKEFIAGFDLIECSDLDAAIEVTARHPSSWFAPVEIRPFIERPQLGRLGSAFARGDDSAGTPYLLVSWIDADAAPPSDDDATWREHAAWRQDLGAHGFHVLGSRLGGVDTATTVRVREGQTVLRDGPGIETREFVAAIDVVSCAERPQAIELASAHPLARHHAIEVRPFYSE